MWPDAGWVEPVSSIQRPLQVPPSDPGASPTKTVAVNCDWLPYIRAALWALTFQTTWKAAGGALTLAQSQAMTLISMFDECAGGLPPFSCPYDFPDASSGAPFALQTDLYDNTTPRGLFIPTVGWATADTYEPGGHAYWEFLDIAANLGGTVELGIVQAVLGAYTRGSSYLGHLHDNLSGFRAYHSGAVVATALIPSDDPAWHAGGAFVHDFGGVSVDKLRFSLVVGITSSSPPDGFGAVVEIDLAGHAASFACP